MNKKIGTYKIKTVHKTKDKYSIEVKGYGAFTFIKTYIMVFASKSNFSSNKLTYSNTIKYLNKHKQDSVCIKINKDNKYDVFSYEKGKYVIDNISFTGNMMYFNEPIDIKNIFAENKGYFVSLKKLEEHKFVTNDKERGEKIIYFYKNNILVKAIVEKGIFTIVMKLTKDVKN